jgi:hypothetical protein
MNAWIRTLAWQSVAVVALISGGPAPAAPPDKDKPTADDVAKVEKVVKDHLEKTGGPAANVQYVQYDPVWHAFPKYYFFTAFFRLYPVAAAPPEGLKSSNIFVVGPDGKPKLINDTKALEEFFRTNLPGIKEDDAAKDAVRAWLRLSQEFRQDGFYQFQLMDDSTKVARDGDARVASGKTVVMKGGNGELNVTLKFDADGKLVKNGVTEEGNLKPGPRPICQATKLLDADPIVRRMAEQDLLIMGRAAKSYLDEQRAKASPELQRAIDRLWQRILDEGR